MRERSRCPTSAGALQRRWQAEVLALRRRHPTWGGDKLIGRLRLLYPGLPLPAVRTASRWLRAAGVVRRRRVRARGGPRIAVPACIAAVAPNQVWTLDFKGPIALANARQVQPLTVRDAASRYVLGVVALRRRDERSVRRALVRLFRRYGRPQAIHVDNGAPFGGSGPRGLTALSAWWLQLGITVEFSRPACPQDNPAHEQMHAVLHAETACPPAPSLAAQQRRFERWRRCYNYVRPHAALAHATPACHYQPGPAHSGQARAFVYPAAWRRLCLDARGRAFWSGRQRIIGRAFAHQLVGLRPLAGCTAVYFGPHLIGTLHADDPAGLRPVRLRRRQVKGGRGLRPLPHTLPIFDDQSQSLSPISGQIV